MKLQDILFSQGFGTRYDCAKIIESGAIRIGEIVHDDPDEEIDPSDLCFTYRDQIWPYFEKAIIAMNKPAGYECSMKPSAHPSVMSLLPSPLRKRNMQPIGRLDVDTTGLLLFTDDGSLQHFLIHPKRKIEKEYLVTCKHTITESMCKQLIDGVLLDDEKFPIKAAHADMLDEQRLLLTLTQGKYHQVKRMVAACSNRVVDLHRQRFGRYTLPTDLATGQWTWIRSKTEILG